MKKFITVSKTQTQKLGEALARELRGGEIVCLSGDLGSGKTTFTQGLLKGLNLKGPYTSPTFVVMKQYKKNATKIQSASWRTKFKILNIYHIDAYRIESEDLLELGWEEIISNNPPAGGNIVIIEWAERVRPIIPKKSLWIKFTWLDENKREIKLT
jgi:tRNA threonylcarbamoyladenosine biosynthesis protein TsaE